MDWLTSRTWAAASIGTALFIFSLVARGDAPGVDVGSAENGPTAVFAARPILVGELSACSFREPLCVHASRRAAGKKVLATLASAERSWEIATHVLRLPPPDVDLATGTFDVYLIGEVSAGAEAKLSARDPIASFDRASAFMIVSEDLEGCALDTAIARETTRASLWRTAPATDAGTAHAETAYLARLMVPCALQELEGVDTFQAHPELSIAGSLGPAADYELGASLFYWWLDWSFGNAPGSVVRALWALAPTRTPAGSWRWAGRPDGFDVLRASFKNALTTGSTLDDLLLDFAVAREFFGTTSDEAHMPETRSLGEAARVRTEWDVAWPAEPRSLASGRGLEPTGAAYVVVECSSAPKGARLRIEARWEEHAKLRWAALKLDGAGHEEAWVAIPTAERATEAQITIVDLENVAKVVLVGTNAGDPLDPFDPNDPVWEPHGWVVSVAAERP
jgi:hypothetical protein